MTQLLIDIGSASARTYYAVLKAVFRPRRKVAFLSRQAGEPSRDFRMLAEELRRRDMGLEIVVRCQPIGAGLAGRVAAIGAMLGQMYHLATARVCVIDGYVIPVSLLNHRATLTVVQMWHALGAVKRFGYQSVDRPGGHSSALARSMRMHRNYDVVLCSGPGTVPFFAEAFDVEPSRVRLTGLPRIDYLLARRTNDDGAGEPPALAELRRRFPALADPGRTVALYAPTMRTGAAGRAGEIASRLASSGCVLIVKPHPLESFAVKGDHVVDATGCDVLDLLSICDVVVTDYSAVALEAAAIDLPVLFWVHDIAEYRSQVGLNVDPLVEYPSVASTDLEPLARMIEARAFDRAVTASLRDRFVSTADGRCTQRIADLVMGYLEGV